MRTAVVTGATQGLGLHAARTIAATPGWRVVLAVRDPARGRAVAAGLDGAGHDVVALDLASLASVRAAADALRAGPPLDALVLNAGIQFTTADRATADGFEQTFGVNHLGHALLAELLLDRLAPGAHVVVVSSGTHYGTLRGSLGYPAPRWPEDPRELAVPHPGSGQVAYATSKLANAMFGFDLARRLEGRARVNVYDPGLMPATGLARAYPAPVRALYRALTPVLTTLVPGATTPRRSGALLAALATGASHAGETGRYVQLRRVKEASATARDRTRQEALRAATAELVSDPAGRAAGAGDAGPAPARALR
jgi:NAD(P)-dependent dehydrogenase (short-subunit alcohol dehydrogenase family)